MGRGDSLALVRNPPRDGVSIKILVAVHLSTQSSIECKMNQENISDNNINGAGTCIGECPSFGRCPVDE